MNVMIQAKAALVALSLFTAASFAAAQSESTSGTSTVVTGKCLGELHLASDIEAAANVECPSVCGQRDGTWDGGSSSLPTVLGGQFGGVSPNAPAVAFVTCSCSLSQEQASRRPACAF